MHREICQYFDMEEDILSFDPDKSILLCKIKDSGKSRWIKKLHDISGIYDVSEDGSRFYIAAESGEISGNFLALNKRDGTSSWATPGKALFHILFDDYIYIIFIDGNKNYYLLKMNKENGAAVWYHNVTDDLAEYSFTRKRIILTYASGRVERISPETGTEI